MLDRIASERWFRASAVFGFWPANSEGDDILVYGDEQRTKPIAVLHTLRQQLTRREGRANVALADFIAPRASGLADHIGAFMVTAGIGEDDVAERFKQANDDYSAIMVKALADQRLPARLARLRCMMSERPSPGSPGQPRESRTSRIGRKRLPSNRAGHEDTTLPRRQPLRYRRG